MREITKVEILYLFEKGLLTDHEFVGDRVIAKKQRDDNLGEETIFCLV